MQEQGTISQVNASNNDNTSQMTSHFLHAGQVRGVTQASLNNISDAMSRRCTVSAFYTNFATLCHPKIDCHLNIFSFNQMSNLSLSGSVRFSCRHLWCQ
jgi:hypothetical protein